MAAPDSGANFCDASSGCLAALTALESALWSCGGTSNPDTGSAAAVIYSEVQADCSVIRRQLVRGQFTRIWRSCLRSGELLVRLLHKSDKIQALLSAHGCPLLPLQEGAPHLDWRILRSRFLGNWCNILNVMRYMQRKCPALKLQCQGPGTGEAIVDSLDSKKSEELILVALTQCMTLLYYDRILALVQQSKSSETDTNGSLLLQACSQQHCQQQQPQQMHQQTLDFNNNAGKGSALKNRQQPKQPDQQSLQKKQAQTSRRRKQPLPAPKLDRLKDGKRVTCVYDTTTEDGTAMSSAAVAFSNNVSNSANAAVPDPTVVPTAAVVAIGHGDCPGDGAGKSLDRPVSAGDQGLVSFDSRALDSILQHLDAARSLLTVASAGKEKEPQLEQQPLEQQPQSRPSPVLQKLQEYNQKQQQQQKRNRKQVKSQDRQQQLTFQSQDSTRVGNQPIRRRTSPDQRQQQSQQKPIKSKKKQSQKLQQRQSKNPKPRRGDGSNSVQEDSSTHTGDEESQDSASESAVPLVSIIRKQNRRGASGGVSKSAKSNNRARQRHRQRSSSENSSDNQDASGSQSNNDGDNQSDDGPTMKGSMRWKTSDRNKSNAGLVSDQSGQPQAVATVAIDVDPIGSIPSRRKVPAKKLHSAKPITALMASLAGGGNASDTAGAQPSINQPEPKQRKPQVSSPNAADQSGGNKEITQTIQELILRLQSVLSEDVN